MGDSVEMIMDGVLCKVCGGYIDDGEEPGHPRTCDSCREDRKNEQKSGKS